MARFEFHFDFGSPNAYLSHRVIPAIEERTGATITYVPVLLGGVFKATGNASPMVTMAGIENKLKYQQVETDRFVKAHAISNYKMNPHFPVNTLQIMRAAIAAEEEGLLMPYVEAVYRAMWEDQKKMDDPEVITATLEEAGLPAAHLLQRATEPAIKEKLLTNTNASVARGNFGSPTFFATDDSRDEMFFGKDKLRDFEDMILAMKG